MTNILRSMLVAVGCAGLALAAGMFFQQPWALWMWPWQASPLSCVFLSSILAAVGAPVVWIGLSGEFRSVEAGGLNLALMYLGMSVSVFLFHQQSHRTDELVFAAATLAFGLMALGLAVLSRRVPMRDARPVPTAVRWSFAAFAVVLVVVGSLLVARRPHVFPWPLPDEVSVMYGWIFLGASVYFIHGVARPSWHNAKGQLIGFLAYDLVLIVPYARHFQTVLPEHFTSLVIYMTVIVYSAALAVWFLAIRPPEPAP